jgi:hypothetical protein
VAAAGCEADAALRVEWRRLVGEILPAAASAHPDWPVRLDHCFARIILDAVCGQPWREVLKPPAWRSMDATQLNAALALGEAIRTGRADLQALNLASLRVRGKLRPML